MTTFQAASNKSKTVCIVLCCLGFIGLGGLHRFYVGKIGTGCLWLFTWVCCIPGTIVDLVMLCMNKFTDKDGYIVAV